MALTNKHTANHPLNASTFSRGTYPRHIRSRRQLIDWMIKKDKAERDHASERALFIAICHVPSTRENFRDPSVIRWFDQTTCDVICSAVGHA